MDVDADGAPGPRELLLRAVIEEVAERGYDAATADHISQRAGVPHAVFLDMFGEKQTCFLAAYRGCADDLIAHVTVPIENAPGYRECVQAGLTAFLMYLAEHPSSARACLVEGFGAGPEAIEIRDAVMRSFARFLDSLQQRALPGVDPMPLLSEATVGGVYETVMTRIRSNQVSALPRLTSPLAYFLLAPLVGHEIARREVGLSSEPLGDSSDA
jgi:AcrR family transcriptional regulator